MKTNILFFLLLLSFSGFAQDSLQSDTLRTKIFSLTPRTKKADKVNGMAIGLGFDIDKDNTIKEVNGLNVEINPLTILFLMFDDPQRRGFSEKPTLNVNGLNIGTGHSNQNEEIAYSGLEISLINAGYSCNGISVNGFYNHATNLNGIHLSGLANSSKKSNGLAVAFSNDAQKMNGMQLGIFGKADYFNGVQIGISNKSNQFNGLQIGVVNRCKTQNGLQIGFWNSNTKRSFPFINW